jgi:hypothetical protein
MSGQETRSHRDELLKAFHMGPEDLTANRAGSLGPNQARRLVRSGYWNLAGVAVIVFGLLAIMWAVAEKPLKPVQWVLVTILIVGGVILGAVQFRRLRASVAAGAVECITGMVRVRLRGRAGWYLYVGDRDFHLPIQRWHLPVEAPYRVYIAPRAKRVVAMEPEGWG